MIRNYLAVLIRWSAKILSFNALRFLPLVLLAALPGCTGKSEYFYGNYWLRQDADDGNTAFRFVTLGSGPFTGQPIQPAIPTWAIGAVTLADDDSKLYIATHAQTFEIYDRQTGLRIGPEPTPTGYDMTSAPTIGDKQTAYVGGQYGYVWRFER